MFRWLVVPIGKELSGSGARRPGTVAGIGLFRPPLPPPGGAGRLPGRPLQQTNVIIGCKVAEVLLMVLGIASILLGNLTLMFVVLALMGAQAALFSPAKMGSIPELVRSDRISAANGLIG